MTSRKSPLDSHSNSVGKTEVTVAIQGFLVEVKEGMKEIGYTNDYNLNGRAITGEEDKERR